ncbi:hypothetical protein ACJX0J_016124, partial [Zea mays]
SKFALVKEGEQDENIVLSTLAAPEIMAAMDKAKATIHDPLFESSDEDEQTKISIQSYGGVHMEDCKKGYKPLEIGQILQHFSGCMGNPLFVESDLQHEDGK